MEEPKRDAEGSAWYVGKSPSFVNLLKLTKGNLYLHLLMQGDLKINPNYVPERLSAWENDKRRLIHCYAGSDNKPSALLSFRTLSLKILIDQLQQAPTFFAASKVGKFSVEGNK